MNDELYGVVALQAHVAGAGYAEFDHIVDASIHARRQVCAVSGAQDPEAIAFDADPERPGYWFSEGDDWVVSVRQWR
jgi:hypothetical protein